MKTKFYAPFVFAFAIGCQTTFPALAVTDENGVYDAAKTATLSDNIIEYDELADLIKEYNPAMALKNLEYYNQITTYQEVKKYLNDAKMEIKDAADDLEKEGDQETADLYRANVKSLNKTQSSIQKQIEQLEEDKSTKSLMQMEHMLTASAQSLMNSYNQFSARMELTAKQKELQTSAYQDVVAKQQLGIATEAEVKAARKSLETAENTWNALNDSMSEVKRNLCIMTGWSYDSNPEIRKIPEPDLSAIDVLDLEADKQKAIGNNYSLQSQRHSVKGGMSKENKSSRRSVNEAEEQLSITVEDLYEEVKTKRVEHQACISDYESAAQVYNGFKSKYQMGMLSKTEYLQGEVDYLEKKAAKETSALALVQALETYRWAVNGLVTESDKA